MEPSEVTSERDPLLPSKPCVASTATPPRSLSKNNSGHILNSNSRNMIFHCYTYWRNKQPEHSAEDTSKFVTDMLGVSVRTVFRIPTIEKITTEFLEHMELQSLRRCTVLHLLPVIGFKHEKRSRNLLLINRDDITDWRDRYFHDVERYRAEGRKIYLDETSVIAGHTRSIVWTDTVMQKRGRLDFKLSMVDATLREKINQVTAEDWRKSIQHMMEAKCRLDTSGSKHIQPVIIQLDEDDTEEGDRAVWY
ncbi:hypothetical protein HPB50_013898 [Hyalomma asiaticum]|uniref:Uncharacterized protein n=1 Tax=Hyalomma asiaticum TaxID=266040 RepID=A0ACB7THA3_HYAAI|nr:hypothetical protein HPB50_013898 [Hyalomma asiaticum]